MVYPRKRESSLFRYTRVNASIYIVNARLYRLQLMSILHTLMYQLYMTQLPDNLGLCMEVIKINKLLVLQYWSEL